MQKNEGLALLLVAMTFLENAIAATREGDKEARLKYIEKTLNALKCAKRQMEEKPMEINALEMNNDSDS
jgi:hypothetical protein